MSTMHESEPVPTLDEFGARLAVIRWKKGWNQKEAALACGLPHTSWRQWELSGAHPRNFVEVATKISDATGYDDYWIMTGRSRPADGDFQPQQFFGAEVVPAEFDLVRRQGLEPRTQWLSETPGQETCSVTYLDQYRAGHAPAAVLELVV